MSSVGPAKTNEAGGLQGTAQNLGASLGTALIGAILIAALTSGFVDARRDEPRDPRRRPAAVVESCARRASRSCRSTTSSRPRVDAGLPPDQAQAIADDYGDAQLEGLKRAMGAVAIFALLALWFTRRLPPQPLRSDDDAPEPQAA